MTRVAKAWHQACQAEPKLLLAAARRPNFLTKRTLSGLFALHWHEADRLPRGKKARTNGGIMYMYGPAAVDGALCTVGGFQGWRCRIATRAEKELAAAGIRDSAAPWKSPATGAGSPSPAAPKRSNTKK